MQEIELPVGCRSELSFSAQIAVQLRMLVQQVAICTVLHHTPSAGLRGGGGDRRGRGDKVGSWATDRIPTGYLQS